MENNNIRAYVLASFVFMAAALPLLPIGAEGCGHEISSICIEINGSEVCKTSPEGFRPYGEFYEDMASAMLGGEKEACKGESENYFKEDARKLRLKVCGFSTGKEFFSLVNQWARSRDVTYYGDKNNQVVAMFFMPPQHRKKWSGWDRMTVSAISVPVIEKGCTTMQVSPLESWRKVDSQSLYLVAEDIESLRIDIQSFFDEHTISAE